MRKDTLSKGIEYLEFNGYEILNKDLGEKDLVLCLKDNIEQTISIHKMQIKRGDFYFRHHKSQEYWVRKIKQLWVHEDQVGWNRDYFV